MEISLAPVETVETLKCDPVTLEEASYLKKLGEEMIEYCISIGGIGLACPQILVDGETVPKQMFVWMNTDKSFEIVMNPRFTATDKKKTNVVEGCLSYPEKQYYVVRAKRIRALYEKYDQEKNELIKFNKTFSFDKAIIFQHEVSHLIYNEEIGKNMTIAINGIDLGERE